MTDASYLDNYEAFGIAIGMIAVKYHDCDADIITDRLASFVTSGPTAEDNGRHMGFICENLATLAGQLAAMIGELSPIVIERFFDDSTSPVTGRDRQSA